MSSSVTTGSSLVGGGAFTLSSHARPALFGTAGFVFGDDRSRASARTLSHGRRSGHRRPGLSARSRPASTRAASRALNAGIDLILVSYDPAQFHHDERASSRPTAPVGWCPSRLPAAPGAGWYGTIID
jgi:hypothetical protein